MTTNASLDEFVAEADSDSQTDDDSSVVDQLLKPVSPSLGLQLVPGRGDPLYLQNTGTERYLFRDNHERWFILQPSAKKSVDNFVRWVYLPEDKPTEIARTADGPTDGSRLQVRFTERGSRAGGDDGDSDVRQRALARCHLRVWIL